MIRIRAGSGLGDSLYLQSVARHLIKKGHQVEACTDWPELFRPLGDKVQLSKFRRTDIDRVVHYTDGKRNERTTQWQDCCRRAGIGEAELRLDWTPTNHKLLDRLKKPTIAVLLPRKPMDRKDGFGDDLLPNCAVIDRIIQHIGNRAFFVQLGKGDALYSYGGLDLNLAGETSVSDMIDVASVCDAFLGYVSFFVPLAESLNKPGLFVWSRRGLESHVEYIRTITPQKIFHRKDLLSAVIDNELEEKFIKAADALLAKIGTKKGL